ncbi:ribose-5-phosphate isomerase RpiA [Candidatus Bathyarchaeota archaeon]|nr:ribose-5-phosphate isomerase RpiA [Candidatus Bathyarchaeota archaeon]
MSWIEDAKRRAAEEALNLVKDGYVVGLGSGSTTAYFIEGLGKLVRENGFKVLGVASSYQSFILAVENGIPLTTLIEHPRLDLAVDGVDEINGNLEAIKGGGGAMTMEKVVDSSAELFVAIADETKVVKSLGESSPVPLEVLPAAYRVVSLRLMSLGANPMLRAAKSKVGPVVTDNGNLILDAKFGRIENPAELSVKLKAIPGIVETGLFVDLIDVAIIGGKTGVYRLEGER